MDICKKCGKPFEQNTKGRKKLYCSDQCRRELDKENKRIQYIGKREMACRQCGKELPKFKTRFCSDECRNRYENIQKGAISHPEILKKKCIVCGKEFETWRSNKKTCSKECSKYNDNHKPYNSKRERARYLKKCPDAKTQDQIHQESIERKDRIKSEKAERAQIRIKEKAQRDQARAKQKAWNIAHWIEYSETHVCVICKKQYTANYPLSKYCSKQCQRKEPKKRYKEKRAERLEIIDKGITLEAVAERDGNICQICGAPVDWNDKRPAPKTTICGDMYPSVDHIIPVSKGGKDSWDNVQLAHRICNTLKGDMILF